MKTEKLTTVGPMFLKEGDIFTIQGHGYDRKDRLIIGGRFFESGKKTRSKIVRLRKYVAKKTTPTTVDFVAA